MSVAAPLPGDIGLYRIPGIGGLAIAVGQMLLGDGFKSKTHVFIVCADGQVFAAQPGPKGARYDPLENYPGSVFTTGPVDPTQEQRDQILIECERLLGTPYSWLDYLSLACHHFGIRPKRIEDYIKDSGHMICSQLGDEVYKRVGIHLFSDGRLEQDVTPGDIDLAYGEAK